MGFLLLWEVAARLAGSRLLPTASAVVAMMAHEAASGDLLFNLGITLLRVAASFAIAMVLGTALGLALGVWRWLDLAFDSWLIVLLKALKGQRYKLPFIGKYAEQQAGA